MSKPARQIASIYHGSVSAAGAADLPADVYYDTVQWEFSGGAGHRPCPTIGRKKGGGGELSFRCTQRLVFLVRLRRPCLYTNIYLSPIHSFTRTRFLNICTSYAQLTTETKRKKGTERGRRGKRECVCVH